MDMINDVLFKFRYENDVDGIDQLCFCQNWV